MRVVAGFALMLAVIMTGCDTIQAPDAARQDPLPEGAYPRQVVLEGLNKGVVTGRPVVDEPTADQPMRVSVPVRSVTDKELNVQYRFEFFDARNRPTRDQPGWRYVRIAGKSSVTAESAATDTNAVGWRLEIRPAR